MHGARHHPDQANQPDPEDGFASSPIVSSAVRSLRQFGGELTRQQARTLLSLWVHEPTLTPGEAAAILARFPAGDDELVDRGHPPVNATGW